MSATTKAQQSTGDSRSDFKDRGWGWRAMFVGSGITGLVGGSMHPASESSKDSLRDEFATMMSDDAWIPGHALMALSAALLALGLWQVHRRQLWPAVAKRPLAVAAIVAPLYVIETVFHLMSYVDVDRLESGDFPPVAWTHVGLAAVLYPAMGLALLWLAFTLAPTWSLPQRAFAYGGVLGGVAFALSLPLTLLVPDMETSPFFAVGGILIAFWSIAAGLVGVRSTR